MRITNNLKGTLNITITAKDISQDDAENIISILTNAINGQYVPFPDIYCKIKSATLGNSDNETETELCEDSKSFSEDKFILDTSGKTTVTLPITNISGSEEFDLNLDNSIGNTLSEELNKLKINNSFKPSRHKTTNTVINLDFDDEDETPKDFLFTIKNGIIYFNKYKDNVPSVINSYLTVSEAIQGLKNLGIIYEKENEEEVLDLRSKVSESETIVKENKPMIRRSIKLNRR